MSKFSNIDKYAGKSIVPIRCADVQGTCFYIGSNYFLTAYHNVSDAEFDNSAVIVTINNKEYPCQFIKLIEMDVAILKSYDDIDELISEPIKLLNTPFKEGLELQIIGYPQEIGNGIDFFNVGIKNVRELSNCNRGFDIIVQRTDAFGFYSYSGYSGSPVINEFGYAIGVVTDQIHKTLGYTSIKSIDAELAKHNISICYNADELDTRPYGIGTCSKMAEIAISKVKSRYNENCHVEDYNFENYIANFCGINRGITKQILRDEYVRWYQSLPKPCMEFCDSYSHFKSYLDTGIMDEKFYYDIEAIIIKSEKSSKGNRYLSGYYLKSFQKLIDKVHEVLKIEHTYQERFLFITGNAGCGKTQQLCHTVKKLSKKANVYLLFGTDFNPTEEVLHTIAKTYNWPKDTFLEELNDEMKSKDTYATLIIDALNEGEGTLFWIDKLPHIKHVIDQYDHLKLIISVRTMENGDKLKYVIQKDRWREWVFLGFQSDKKCNEAISKYFINSGINANPADYSQYALFKIPLFVKIFCDVYHSLPYDSRKDIDILSLYQIYLHKRNYEVSMYADEDPERNVTEQLLNKIGQYSLNSCLCCDIPREKALSIANKLCKHRLWSNNLYHSAIRSNLLIEYKKDNMGMTTFEFDNMGDYIRAGVIMSSHPTDEKRFITILELAAKYNNARSAKCKYQIRNTIVAFLSVWNPEKSYWQRNEMKNMFFRSVLLDSLSNRNLKSGKSTLDDVDISDLIIDNILNVKYIFQHFTLFKDKLIDKLHSRLHSMSMVERDEKWTIEVNNLWETHQLRSTINNVLSLNNEKDIQVYINILCWMMSSSHPGVRYYLIRVIKQYLEDYPHMCITFIELFYNVNDSYILYGLYAAIYGILLLKNNNELTHSVAEKVYHLHYEKQINIPSEISVRVWTLKILEYNHYLNPTDLYWDMAQPPYIPSCNLMEYDSAENYYDKTYFGEGGGAMSLHHSLFGRDFNRYIIGTNNYSRSTTFIKDGQGVSLDDITCAVANRIKNVYGYSNTLSIYDEHIGWDNNVVKTKERIGKKYQWLALGEIKAYLSDTCDMTKDWITEELADKPYPWYSDKQIYFDPTFNLDDNHVTIDNDLFDCFPREDLFDLPSSEWVNSKECMPRTNILIKDKSGREWVVLVGYQKYIEVDNDEMRESFMYYSPCLVKKNDADKFSDWAKDQNFYGRWMPENTGICEFIWNEYPWSDVAKQFASVETEIWKNNPPCKILLPYSAQYQENRNAIYDEESVNSTVYMPLKQMYERFGLMNAERGVVRNCKNEIVAISRNISGDAFDGLVIRRDILNEFLDAEEYELFYCNLGEKQLWLGKYLSEMQRLSSCYQYIKDSCPIIIQPMKDERDFPKQQYERDYDDNTLKDLLGITVD